MPASRLPFSSRQRLVHDREFQAVFDARVRKGIHPISVFARPNALGHCRLGLSVPRRGGTAVRRNRVKRLLREAFRLMQHEMPGSYDFVIVARLHEPRELSWYQRALRECIESVHRQWSTSRSKKRLETTAGDPPDSQPES